MIGPMARSVLPTLIVTNLRRNLRNLIMSSLGILVGIASFVFFVSLGAGVRKVVTGDVLGALPSNHLEIVRKRYKFGVFRLGAGGLTGKGGIRPIHLERFKSLPEVKTVHARMGLRIPARAVIEIPEAFRKRGLPRGFYTDIVGDGIAPRAIPKKDLEGTEFRYAPGEEIPVLISRRLLELYNATLAELKGLPRLTATAVRAIRFKMTLGHSTLRPARGAEIRKVMTVRCRVAGVSSRAILLGITLPLEYVRQFNKRFLGKDGASVYSSAILVVRSPDMVPRLLRKLDRMGFALEAGQVLARKVGDVISLVTILLSLISAVIMAIAAVGIAHVFFMAVHERRREIGILRAVGATRWEIRWIVMGEAAVVGAVAGVGGLILGRGAAWLCDLLARRFDGMPFQPDSFFLFPWWVYPGAVVFAIVFCFVGAFFPARRAAAVDPARVLTGQ